MPRATQPAPRTAVAETPTVGDRRLDNLRRFAWLLDNSIPVPGTRFRIGLDAIIGLIPGIGDLAGGAASVWFVLQAARLGAPKSVVARMVANVAIETIVGAVPLLGDLFDAGWKANARNMALVERHAVAPSAARTSSRKFFAALGVGLALMLVGAAVLAVLGIRALSEILQRTF